MFHFLQIFFFIAIRGPFTWRGSCPCPAPRTLLRDPIKLHEDTPAQQDAGRLSLDVRRSKDVDLEMTRLVVKLEVVRGMYWELLKREVVTNTIETEVAKMVKERMTGPMGHALLLRDLDRREQKHVESESWSRDRNECWWNLTLVKRMMALRKKVVTSQLRKANDELVDQMRYMAVSRSSV